MSRCMAGCRCSPLLLLQLLLLLHLRVLLQPQAPAAAAAASPAGHATSRQWFDEHSTLCHMCIRFRCRVLFRVNPNPKPQPEHCLMPYACIDGNIAKA
jgi:hypothetical protein